MAPKVALAIVSLLVMSLTGYAWAAMQGLVNGLTMADVIDDGPKPADGARDILLVGMDSRTDAQGNPLPKKMLAKLNAGVADGELNTDTLIFVRIPNDGSKATAMSLPRDSYVDIPGYGKHKINSAYARAKSDARQQLQAEGVSDESDLEVRSNQAGAKKLIETVEGVTGASIDNYASINLLGFHDITKAIGGVEVCLNQPVDDPYSGAKFDAGRQTISGHQALAFVRQRHGLLRGDLDRVVRQQVFMAGLARKVVSAGTLADPAKLNGLIDSVQKSVVVNKGWDLLGFAQQLQGLSAGNIEFTTIPVANPEYETPSDGQAVQVDPAQVQSYVRELAGQKNSDESSKPAPEPSKITVDVLNGSDITGLAGSVSETLTSAGFGQGEVGNTDPRTTTVVQAAEGEKATGEKVAETLGDVSVETNASVPTGQVQVLLGPDYEAPANSGGGAAPGSAPGGAPSGLRAQAQPEPSQQQPGDEPISADGVTCVN
ncbi:LCP family protein required for cell wall assembly [Prauserella sediminis]|uniref:LCP family protein required for cell wall assembly n=1 Tax=Prauserella sediminis TaxID=577680 RepID=A0A839XEW4_9PSEU|nr:LCP family protein [Prauserella sediminis]MBB3661291.1 LCP family protein required for cell wall assembly [Prauserella sediminis]